MEKYLCNSIMGTFILYAFVCALFLVGAFLLWDAQVIVKFWNISFAVFRVCVVASFIVCVTTYWED